MTRFRLYLLQSVAWRTFAPACPSIIYALPGHRLRAIMDAGADDVGGKA